MNYEQPITGHRAIHRSVTNRHLAARFCTKGLQLPLGFLVALLVVLGNLQLAVAEHAIPLITDGTFSRGFSVIAPNGTTEGDLQWDASGGPPAWQLAQWNSQSSIFGTTPTQLPSGAYRYTNADKELIAGGGALAGESDLILSVDGNNEYGGVYRTSVSDPWPALLVQQRISNPGGQLGMNTPSIAEMVGLDLKVSEKLLFDNQNIGPGYNSAIHSSQFVLFHTIQNLNPSSSGFGDFIWFGTSIYDDRQAVTSLNVQQDTGTGKLIYNTGIAPYTSEVVANGNWVNVNGDILPNIKLGLQEAWNQGFLSDSQDFADYYIGGMNIGWEVTGLNNASMQLRNYGLSARTVQFNDDVNTKVLWHMEADESLVPPIGGTPRIDDDNSTGRPEFDLKFAGPASTHPSVVSGSLNGTNALSFDGVDDVADALGAWPGATESLTTISLDALVRPQNFPSDANNLIHVVGAQDWRLWWRRIGPPENNTGRFDFWINTPGVGDGFTKVAGPNVALDGWYDVQAVLDADGNIMLTVDGVTNTASLTPGFPMAQNDSMVRVGGDLFNVAGREFAGLIDEVRIATTPAATSIHGDFDGDDDVDGADFLAWQRGFGTTFDGNDLADWESNFGTTAAPAIAAGSSAAVPEPASWSLFLLAIGTVGQIRRRRKWNQAFPLKFTGRSDFG